jgi:transcriptional regulator with XRE-family HTH domain
MNAINLENNNMSVFQQIRKKAKISQTELAKVLGVTNVTLSRWESGMHTPTLTFKQIKTLNYILMGMGLSLNDLPDDPFGKIDNLDLEYTLKIIPQKKIKVAKESPTDSSSVDPFYKIG